VEEIDTTPHEDREAGSGMGKHENKAEGDGQGTFDPNKTKDVNNAGDGRHDSDDKGEDK
jgi:hypothetical protein